MINTISYYENNARFDVYKTVQSGFIKMLIKKDNKPYKIQIFYPDSNNWILMKPGQINL